MIDASRAVDKINTTRLVVYISEELKETEVFQNRLTAWLSSAPASAQAAVVCCHGSFAAVPASFLGTANSNTDAMQQIYAAAFEAARRQIARRAVIESWNLSLN